MCFFTHPALRGRERQVYGVSVVLYFLAALAAMQGRDDYGNHTAVFTLYGVACAMAIWYISICAREVLRMDAKPSPEQRDMQDEL